MVANRRVAAGLAVVALIAASALAVAGSQQAAALPFAAMAERIATALKPGTGERAMLRFDPDVMPELEKATRVALEKRGVKVESLEYGPSERFEERLAQTDIYIWLPTRRITPADQVSALVKWLDAGRGRQIHFHWGDGTRAVDSTNGEHNAAYDRIYVDALNIDYAALDRAQSAAIRSLRSREVHVTNPDGTDLRFRLGDRTVTKQNGDASRDAMKNARVRIDREIELPAGAIRVAPLEESVNGLMVIPQARIRGVDVKGLRLKFANGVITQMTAETNLRAVQDYFTQGALRNFREFALGFNPKLHAPAGSPWMAYYGYGAGMVRLSLGDNSELGGKVTGGSVHWFFFPRSTVRIGERVLVRDGVLQ